MIDNLRRATALLVVSIGFLTVMPALGQWQEVWSDEFDSSAVDPAKWTLETGTGAPNCGWGNLELQYYREENATVENGALVITAKREASAGDICAPGYEYTSARLSTSDKVDWLYGRFEISAKLPKGVGMWPAIWMLPAKSAYGSWAASGEIDIMEMNGRTPNEVLGTIYYGAPFPNQSTSSQTYTLSSGDFSDAFHTFALEWDPWQLRWFVDTELFRTETSWFSINGRYPAPFDRNFYLLLNLAVGGNFPGPPDETTIFPQTMEVDYVRVYRAVEGIPEVSLVSPSGTSNLDTGSTLNLSAVANDSDGNVILVEFLQDEGVLVSSRTEPYSGSVSNLYPGCYQVRARVTDNIGRTNTTEPVEITVGGECTEQTPYLMAAAPIPGVIEAEYYDLGGPDVAYRDTDQGNVVDAFRENEDVDVVRAGLDAGYGVIRIVRGEWLEYTVDVKEAGTYQLTSRIASVADSGFRLEFDGVDKTGRISVSATGGELSWTNLITQGIQLEPGVQVLRFVPSTSGIGLSRLTFAKTGSIGTEETPSPNNRVVLDSYPNPFPGTADVVFEIDRSADVVIDLYDLLGRNIDRITTGRYPAGTHRVTLSAHELPMGTYFLRLSADGEHVTVPITRLP